MQIIIICVFHRPASAVTVIRTLRSLSPIGCAVLLALTAAASWAESRTTEIDQLVGRWVALEQQRMALQSNWRDRERAGELQLALLKQESATLSTFLDREERDLGDVDARRNEMTAEQSEFERRQSELAALLPAWAGRIEGMSHRLPPPLQSLWTESSERLAASAAAAAGTAGVASGAAAPGGAGSVTEQLTELLKLLSDVADFGRRIALHRDTMEINGKTVQTEQVYLGLSQGWYLTADDALAGAGRSTPDGWVWEHGVLDETDRAELRRLIDASRSPTATELVTLPITLK